MAKGADGYLLKTANQQEVLHAISTVLEGKKFFSQDVTFSLLNDSSNQSISSTKSSTLELNSLTEREIEILCLVAQGLTNKEIGDQLYISHRTVDTHRTNLMKKLNLNNVASLIRFAYKNGLVE